MQEEATFHSHEIWFSYVSNRSMEFRNKSHLQNFFPAAIQLLESRKPPLCENTKWGWNPKIEGPGDADSVFVTYFDWNICWIKGNHSKLSNERLRRLCLRWGCWSANNLSDDQPDDRFGCTKPTKFWSGYLKVIPSPLGSMCLISTFGRWNPEGITHIVNWILWNSENLD